MFTGINHVTVVVKDKQEAEKFYCDILGFEKKDVGKSLWVKIGNQYIHINENPDLLRKNTFHHFAVEVKGLIPFLQTLIEKGVEVFDLGNNIEKIDLNTNLQKEGRTYFVYDPSGNLIEFIDSDNSFFKP